MLLLKVSEERPILFVENGLKRTVLSQYEGVGGFEEFLFSYAQTTVFCFIQILFHQLFRVIPCLNDGKC